MADDNVVLRSSLCYLVKKFSKIAVKPLKSMVLDFYDVEELNAAKQQLLTDIDNMNLDVNLPHVPVQRDGDQKAVRIVDDIFTLLTFLDENLKLSLLPCYVIDNPDSIPSGRLYEGDLSVLLRFMQKMESEVKELKLALAAITNVYNLAETQVKGSHRIATDSTSVNNKPAQPTDVHLLSADFMNECRPPSQRFWADEPTSDSNLCDDQIESDDQNEWQVTRRRKSKRRRVRSDLNSNAVGSLPLNLLSDVVVPDNLPSGTVNYVQQSSTSAYPSLQRSDAVSMNSTAALTTVSRPSYTAVAQSQPQQQDPPRQQVQTQQRKKPPVIVGRSRITTMSHAGSTTHVAAAKPYISKATFCIDNVSTEVSELTMAKFVAAMDIDVLGCYNVKPRRSPYQRMHGIEPRDRKAFRLCIPREDTARLMDPKKWPAHISVSRWIFKANSARPVDSHVPATSDVRQFAGRDATSRNDDSNTVTVSLSAAAAGAGNVPNTEVQQSTPPMVTLSPTGGNVDMDATIILDNGDNDGDSC